MANLILHKRMSIAQYNTFKTLHTVNGVLDDEFKNTLFVLNETGTFTGTSDCIFYMGEHLLSYASYKKALSLSASSTDNQFPTAKCVYDAVKDKADSATTLSGYGITDAYTKTEIDAKLTTVYKAAGSAATVSALGSLDAQHEGFVYNMSAAFETTSNFVEGAGKSYPVGTNVVIVNTGTIASPVYKYDILAGETFKPSINITWSALKNLRDNGNLVPGTWYRITDYTCTTTQTDTQSAGHVFDIIVKADDVNVLNENAFATHHSGDTYFVNSKVETWELKYCLDNDTNRFAWADSTNGKGVIYWMKDEFGNEAGYDFKNIQMKFYKITAVTTVPEGLNDTYSVSKIIVLNDYTISYGCTVDSGDTEFRYTFDYFTDSTHSDYSLNTYGTDSPKLCHDNVIPILYGSSSWGKDDVSSKLQWINFISFRCTSYFSSCFGNIFGDRCYNISFGDECYSNTFGNSCIYNTFGDGCNSNTFGDECYSNTFGDGCIYNTFGKNCNSNTFGDNYISNTFGYGCSENTFAIGCSSNIFGDECYYNTFRDECYYNTFGNGCCNNTFGSRCITNTFWNECSGNIFGNSCIYNTFLNYCCYNTFGDVCYYNTFGNSCSSNIFGDECYSNTFGNSCIYNTFGDVCYSNTFGNDCNYIKFGDSSNTKSYYRYIIIENGNQYIYLNCTATTSYSVYYQNVTIAQGVNNTDTYKTITDSNVGQTVKTTYQPANSQTISV